MEQNPLLEWHRYHIMHDIIKETEKIYKLYSIKIELIARWIFANSKDLSVDPVFPHNAKNNVQLIKDLQGLKLPYDIHVIIKELDFCNKFNDAIKKISDIIKTPLYQTQIKKDTQIKSIVTKDYYHFTFNSTDFVLEQIKPLHINLYHK